MWLMKLIHLFGYHWWSIWTEPEVITKGTGVLKLSYVVQHRQCKICLKYETRDVRYD